MTMRSYSLRRRVAHEDGLLQAAAALPLTYVGRQHRRRLPGPCRRVHTGRAPARSIFLSPIVIP